MTVDDKSNKIPAVPKPLKLLDLSGSVVTLYAMQMPDKDRQVHR
ncbi:hypothetical protein V7x_25710 [Crateriforma conspicua]|uniref:Uncharacterized protein n=1 Tax=Crateriforma conspicua TaxID=2527996 RepID=A0A5C6FVQ4_9PLAN|nr:hypothetical protein V7x_25710 [Crateriforma conspicua]